MKLKKESCDDAQHLFRTSRPDIVIADSCCLTARPGFVAAFERN
jgi:hypothetical protein